MREREHGARDRTLLEQKIRERRQTFEEFVDFAEAFAREHGEPGTLSVRHLKRLAAGSGPNGQPPGRVRPATARLLEKIFNLSVEDLLAARQPARIATDVQGEDLRNHGVGLTSSIDWLDRQAGWIPDTARRRVTSLLAQLDDRELAERSMRRANVGRDQLAHALADYYQGDVQGYSRYCAQLGASRFATSILTRDRWLDLACSLTTGSERLSLAGAATQSFVASDEVESRQAVHRLAEAAASGTRIANVPLYRLTSIDLLPGSIAGTVETVPFVEYALTADLLEGELVDAVATGAPTERGELPLRDRYLPDLESVIDLPSRLCAGGVVALCAIARPAEAGRDAPDYALLIQQRSSQVLNAKGRLSVIPKGFHEPLKDVRADAPIGATLLREMEEELFGRREVDSTIGEQRVAAPMHPQRLSEPMRWLTEQPGRLRIECTGFGLNLVSGNYEFAGLIVIDDDEFWNRYGGHLEANWEASGLQLYSSLDQELVTQLAVEPAWSNEGLFAFLQGIRRLREVGGARVELPAVG